MQSTTATNNTTEAISSTNTGDNDLYDEENNTYVPPWSVPQLKDRSSSRSSRFRQHVNPLARRYQMSTDLPDQWPQSDFANVNLPLYLDIGCGKGGFLLELVGRRYGQRQRNIKDDSYMNSTKTFADTTNDWLPIDMNYLGLEIRPGVSQYAQKRVEKRGLDGMLSFVGCNANVDLDRLLSMYQEQHNDGVRKSEEEEMEKNNRLAFVSIQFPDPHFKKGHMKRRVVTAELVTTLAKFQEEGDVVFLQSDIKDALEAMREKFVESNGKLYFDEWLDYDKTNGDGNDDNEYGMDNPLGIPTEREVSVLSKRLSRIYRTLFKRNGVVFEGGS